MIINEYNLDYGKYKNRSNVPTFYGCVEDPRNLDREGVSDLDRDDLIVSFVVSGEYEWYNKNVPNVLQSNYNKKNLTVCSFFRRIRSKLKLRMTRISPRGLPKAVMGGW